MKILCFQQEDIEITNKKIQEKGSFGDLKFISKALNQILMFKCVGFV